MTIDINDLIAGIAAEGRSADQIETQLRKLGQQRQLSDVEVRQAVRDATVIRGLPADQAVALEEAAARLGTPEVLESNFLDTGSAPEPDGPQDIESSESRGGEQFAFAGRYVLLEEIGRGGMGIVYRALDMRRAEMQDRQPHVAIKILGDEFKRHPMAMISLQREARKTQTLAHPNILTVYDFNRDGDTAFMTMELLDGRSLADLIDARAPAGIPWSEAAPLVAGMAEGLAYAHQQGIVHADFKPSNVFVTSRGQAKILDFGIAQAAREGDSKAVEGTAFEVADLGALSPAYASIELLAGETPKPSDDVFALGVIIEEMTTGRHPFDGRNVLQSSMHSGSLKASSRLPRRIRRLTTRMLAWRRSGRPQNAGEVLRELRAAPMRLGIPVAAAVALISIAAVAWLIFEPDSIIREQEFASSELGPGIPVGPEHAQPDPVVSTVTESPDVTGGGLTIDHAELAAMDALSRQHLCNLRDPEWYRYSCEARQNCYRLLAADREAQAGRLPEPLSQERRLHAQLYLELSTVPCAELPMREEESLRQVDY